MDPRFAPVAYDDFLADVTALASAITADDDWQPALIVGIGRGGLVPAVYLSHAIGSPMLSWDWSSRTDRAADDMAKRLAARTTSGDRLLLVDDINDSGATIAALRTALEQESALPEMVRIATLIDNVRSVARVDYFARQIDRTVTKAWFVFPWEALGSPTAIADDARAVPSRIA